MKNMQRIVVGGESNRLRWDSYFDGLIGLQAYVFGNPANWLTINNALTNVDTYVNDYSPDIVHCACAMHDVQQQTTDASYRTDVRAFCDDVRANNPNAYLIWQLWNKINEDWLADVWKGIITNQRIQELNAIAQTEALAAGWDAIHDVYTKSSDYGIDGDLLEPNNDGVHYTEPIGATVAANWVYDVIYPLLISGRNMLGQYENSNLRIGLFPNCAVNMSNQTSGNFAVVRGESAVGNELAALTNFNIGANKGFRADEGLIRFDSANVAHIVLTNLKTALTNSSVFTLEFWMDYQKDVISYWYSEGTDNSNYWGTRVLGGTDKASSIFVNAGSAKQSDATDTMSVGLRHLVITKGDSPNVVSIFIDGSEVSAYDKQETYSFGDFTATKDAVVGALQRNVVALPVSYDLYQFAIYDERKTDQWVADQFAIGANKGGLIGTDNGDGTMTLSAPTTGVIRQSTVKNTISISI